MTTRRTNRIFLLVFLGAWFTACPHAVAENVSFSVSEGTGFSAALSPDGKLIAIDLQGQLWVLPATGGDAKAITDPMDEARFPVWSPDSMRIAFQAYTQNNFHIWTIAADGSDLTQVTFGGFDDREPHWSPDGLEVLFASDRSGTFDIYNLDLGSGAVTQVTEDSTEEYYPVWAPDGSRIAYVSEADGEISLLVQSLNTGEKTVLVNGTDTIHFPAWHPSGDRVTYFSNNRHNFYGGDTSVTEVDVATAETRKLSGEGEDLFPSRVNWKSDDMFMYTGDGSIQVRSYTNDKKTKVEFSAHFVVSGPPEYKKKDHHFQSRANRKTLGILRPQVSPDGNQVVFTALADL